MTLNVREDMCTTVLNLFIPSYTPGATNCECSVESRSFRIIDQKTIQFHSAHPFNTKFCLHKHNGGSPDLLSKRDFNT